MRRLIDFASELFRRKVVRVLLSYVVALWLLAQGFADLFPAFGLPDWSLRAFVAVGIAIIPGLAFLTWKYDLMPPQLVRDRRDADENVHPELSWARRRHYSHDAGQLVLRWHQRDRLQQEDRYTKALSIGRGFENDINLPDRRVSRHHAILWAENAQWHVRDLKSANGTFLDEKRVDGTAALRSECELRFHQEGPVVRVEIEKPERTVVDQNTRD